PYVRHQRREALDILPDLENPLDRCTNAKVLLKLDRVATGADAKQSTELEVGGGTREQSEPDRAEEGAACVASTEPIERRRDPRGAADHPRGRRPAPLHERFAVRRS